MQEELDKILNAIIDGQKLSSNLLVEIRDELKKLNERQSKPREKVRVVNDGLPHIAVIWNEWAHESLPRVVGMDSTSSRFKNAVARWKERSNKDYWVGVIRKMNQSDFCLGKNERSWKADIEWFCRPDVSAKILEGKYDNKAVQSEKKLAGYWNNPVTGQREPIYETVKK